MFARSERESGWPERMLADGNFDAGARFASATQDIAGNGEVLQPEALRFEERDLVARSAAGRAPRHDVAQRSNRAPIQVGGDGIAAFQLRHRDVVDDYAARAPHRGRIELAFLRVVGPDGVDMHAGSQPGAVE